MLPSADRSIEPVKDATRERLLERARVLARPTGIAVSHETVLELVVFALAQEQYAVETALVREVYTLRELTPLPCTPPHVLGIISLRGQILPVLDLKRIFELPSQGITDLNKVIVLGRAEAVVGVLADAVLEVRNVAASNVHAVPATVPPARARYLHGVTDGHLVIINAELLMTDPQLVVDESVTG